MCRTANEQLPCFQNPNCPTTDVQLRAFGLTEAITYVCKDTVRPGNGLALLGLGYMLENNSA